MSAAVLIARVKTSTGADAQQADVAGISVKVFDMTSGSQVGETYAPAVSVVYDALQPADARSTEAYNVAIPLAGSYWPEGGRTYQVQVRFTPTSGDAYMAALYELQAVEVLGD